MINTKKLNHISIFMIICMVIGYVLICDRTVHAQSLEPDPLFLEIESIYRGDKDYKHLPFDPEDPYKRSKNGPTLKNVVHKANKEWLKKWVDNPSAMIPNARMPRLMLSSDDIDAVIAYL